MLMKKMDEVPVNKDYIIVALSAVVLLLLSYIIFSSADVEVQTKIEYETIIEEKIVYEDAECQAREIANIKEDEVDTYTQVEEPIQRYTLFSGSTNNTGYDVSLFSYQKPLSANGYNKVILNGTFSENETKSIFIMDINQIQINEMVDVYFQIHNNSTNITYTTEYACLQNLLADYIYKVDLEIQGSDIMCTVTEDRELEQKHTTNEENLKQSFTKISPENAPKGLLSPININN